MQVVCIMCSACMCWQCGTLIQGYDHFTAEGCPLFDDAEIMRMRLLELQEARARARVVRAPPEGWNGARDAGAPTRGCPYCKARVAKWDNNNHAQCWRAPGPCRCIMPHNAARFSPAAFQ